METSLYHLVVWCIQGEMLITTKLSSVKLLILMGDRKLNLQKSLYIYNVSIISHTIVIDRPFVVTVIKLLNYELTLGILISLEVQLLLNITGIFNSRV